MMKLIRIDDKIWRWKHRFLLHSMDGRITWFGSNVSEVPVDFVLRRLCKRSEIVQLLGRTKIQIVQCSDVEQEQPCSFIQSIAEYIPEVGSIQFSPICSTAHLSNIVATDIPLEYRPTSILSRFPRVSASSRSFMWTSGHFPTFSNPTLTIWSSSEMPKNRRFLICNVWIQRE